MYPMSVWPDGTSASIELLDRDRYHVIDRQLDDERPRIQLLLNAIWETALDTALFSKGRMVLVMTNGEWRPISTGGRFAALSLSDQSSAPSYRIVFLDNREKISGTLTTDKTGGILQPNGLDLRFTWSTRNQNSGYLYMQQPVGAGESMPYQAWSVETFAAVKDIPKDLAALDWWINTYQRIEVKKYGSTPE